MKVNPNNCTRREFLRIAAGAASGLVAAGCNSSRFVGAGETKRPNIIFILADDLGYGDLGCYGQQQIKTPNLDRMAAEGMRFTQHYAGSTVCAPSRCSLMTGLHTGHTRVRANNRVLMRPEDVTVAELLRDAGYHTGMIGKWGVGHPPPPGDPRRNGFDYFFGYLNMLHAHNYYPHYLMRNETKVILKNGQGVATERIEYSHDLFAEDALAFLDRSKDRTFFLYLPFTIPHANNEGGRATGDGMEVPDYGIYKDKPWPKQKKGHAAMITRMDRDIGRLFAKLKELGLDEDTIVFFASDNGPHKEGGADPGFFNSSGPLQGYKRDLYEGGIRVPLIVRRPGKIKAGSSSDHISAFWDFLPTACDLAGIASPGEMDGISIVPTLTGRPSKQEEHEFMYWEFHARGSKQAIRMGDFKAVRLDVFKDPDGPLELYNLKNDIGEKNNVAAQHPEVIAKIETLMKTARTKAPDSPLSKREKQAASE